MHNHRSVNRHMYMYMCMYSEKKLGWGTAAYQELLNQIQERGVFIRGKWYSALPHSLTLFSHPSFPSMLSSYPPPPPPSLPPSLTG